MKLSFTHYLILTIIGIALLTSIIGSFFLLAFGFDGIEFNGDSYVYFLNAKHFFFSAADLAPPKPEYWPYGYPALLSLSFLCFGDISYESARWVNVLGGALLVATLSSLTLFIIRIKKLPNHLSIAIIITTGLSTMGHGLFLKYQLTLMSDIIAAFLCCLLMLLCWRWRTSNNLIDIALAGIVFGLSMSTRYVNALMIFPALTALFWGIDIKQKSVFFRTVLAILVFGAFATITFIPQFYITLQDTSSSLNNGLLNGWHVKNFYTMIHESIDGSQKAKVPSIVYYLSLPFRWQCFTPLGILLVALGIKYSFRELPKWMALSIFMWYAISYILLCGIPLQNARIGFPLFLPIALWFSLGLLECKILWRKQFSKILLGSSIIICISMALSFLSIYDFIQAKNNLRNTAIIVANATPPKSRIISTSLFAVYKAYPMNIKPLSIYQMSIEEAQNLFIEKTPVFLAIDNNHFIPQWSKYPPGKCFRWILDNYSCTIKYTVDEYTVYEVKQKNS